MEPLTVRCTLPSHRAVCAGVDSVLLHVGLFYFLNNGFRLCNWHSVIRHLECLMYWVECSHTLVPSSLWPTWEHVFSSSQKKPWSCERSGVPVFLSRTAFHSLSPPPVCPQECAPLWPPRRFTAWSRSWQCVSWGCGSHVTRALGGHLRCCFWSSLVRLLTLTVPVPSSHLILCRPLLLPPSIFPSIRVFSNESALRIRQPKCSTNGSEELNSYSRLYPSTYIVLRVGPNIWWSNILVLSNSSLN